MARLVSGSSDGRRALQEREEAQAREESAARQMELEAERERERIRMEMEMKMLTLRAMSELFAPARSSPSQNPVKPPTPPATRKARF